MDWSMVVIIVVSFALIAYLIWLIIGLAKEKKKASKSEKVGFADTRAETSQESRE